MMSKKLGCWEVEIRFKDMDMSGGDAVDGPRWTGKWLDVKTTFVIVALTQKLAEAAALSRMYLNQKAEVESANKVCDVDAVVTPHWTEL
jgi:hypothetical protein